MDTPNGSVRMSCEQRATFWIIANIYLALK